MTATPVTIQLDAELEEAVKLMQEHGIRHLPVMDGEDLSGVVTDRDVSLIESRLPDEWYRI
ncbi:MAG: CBS domain-containing protein [Myxococcales bacterium]|nr:CBS domain-containing protein [Myxococcales bacterium]